MQKENKTKAPDQMAAGQATVKLFKEKCPILRKLLKAMKLLLYIYSEQLRIQNPKGYFKFQETI